MKKVLLIILILSLASVVMADQKVTFESGTTVALASQGWANYSGYGNVNATFTISSTYAYAGSAALCAFATLTNNQKVDFGYNNGRFGRPGDTVHSIWLYTPLGTPGLYTKFSWSDSGYAYGEGAGATLNAGSWQQFTITTTFGNKPFRRWGIEAGNYSGSSADINLYVDDAEFTGSGTELVTFDSSTENWDVYGGYGSQPATLSVSSTIMRTGAGSLKVDFTAANAQKVDIGLDGDYSFGNPADTTASLYVYSEDTGAVGMYIKFSCSDNAYGYFEGGGTGYAAVSTWQRYEMDISNVIKPFIRFGMEFYNGTGNSYTGTFYVDDARTETPVAVQEWELY